MSHPTSLAPGPAEPSDDDLDSSWDEEAVVAPAAASVTSKPPLPSAVIAASSVRPAPAPVQASSPSAPRASTPAPPRIAFRPTGEGAPRPAPSSARIRPLTDGHPAVVPARAKAPMEPSRESSRSDAASSSSPVPAPATTTAAATDPRELPAPTLRPPPQVAALPVFVASVPPFDILPPTSGLASAGGSETFRPSEVDRPLSLPPKRGRTRFRNAAALVSMLALGGAAWFKLRPGSQQQRDSQTTVAARALPAQALAPRAPDEPVAAPPAPEPEAAPAQAPELSSAGAPAPSAGPDLASAFAAALSASPNSIAVTVRVTPPGSIIFDHGRRLGTDVVQVNVEPGAKKNLVALLDGYLPRRFTVDGTLNSVSIALRPQGIPAPSDPQVGYTPTTTTPPGPAGPGAKAAAPAKPGKKEAFDPSRDVGSL